MHERSLARVLLRQITELMLIHRALRVRSVQLSVGEFSGIDADLLHSALDDMFCGTPVEGATILIDRVPLEGRCTACELSFPIESYRFVCPQCGTGQVDILRGNELVLETLTLAETDP